jgi:hypothetical protein
VRVGVPKLDPGARGLRLAAAAFCAAGAFGCAAIFGPAEDMPPLGDECVDRIAKAEQSRDRTSRNDALLYYMRLGTYQQVCREFERSAASFEVAKRIGDDLYTKSVSAETLSLLGNDAMRPYPGENFERAMLRIMNVLNYAAENETESALVEARQVDYFLRELQQAEGEGSAYSRDAFGRFLTGMLHEEAGDVDSARISYSLAVEAYRESIQEYGVRVPESLLESLLAVAEQHSEQAVDQAIALGARQPRTLPDGAGEVVVIHQIGRVPDKVEEVINISWGPGWGYATRYHTNQSDVEFRKAQDVALSIAANETFRVAFPLFIDRAYAIKDIDIDVPNHLGISPSVLVSNIGAVAKKDLQDRIHRIRARTIARAAVYFAAQKYAQREMEAQGKQDASNAIAIAGLLRSLVLEHADRRQWDSLPDRINLKTVTLPAGRHSIALNFLSGQGMARTELHTDVEVRPGKRTFLVVRSAR